jgi:ubiquinone/menaquinone biosynthesis C-methylase UbiE
MMPRIPHADETKSVMRDPEEYYQKLKKRSKVQFKPFLKLLRRLDIKGQYLEIGAGPGILASDIAKDFPDIQITAVEPFSDMLDLGKKQIKEMKMQDRVRFIQGNVEEEIFMSSLGKFELVYSTFSLHHWKNPVQALKWMMKATKENGTVMIFDFKRVWCLYYHPKHNGFLDSVRASYLPKEIMRILKETEIKKVNIKIPFPFFWQILIIQN